MKYQAFISYKSEDRGWALKLKASLEARGINDLFYDKDRLETGYSWGPQLASALAESRNIILLYSKHAYKPESFVAFEHWEFHSKYFEPAERNPALPPRKIVYVLLDAPPPPTLSMLHALSALKDSDSEKAEKDRAYTKGAASLPENDPVWKSIVDQVVRALTRDEPGRPVGCFVLAATRADFDKLDFAEKPDDHESIDTAIAQLAVTRDEFLGRYGARPEEWSPFGGQRTIHEMLEQMKGRINTKLAASSVKELATLQIRLELPGEGFWSPSADAWAAEVARWRSQLVVIVLDPMSLYVQRVVRRLNIAAELLANGLATVMVLGTQKAPPVNAFLRDMLRVEANKLHRILCEPELPLVDPQPLGGVNITDEGEMQRLLVTSVGFLARTAAPLPKAPPNPISSTPGS